MSRRPSCQPSPAAVCIVGLGLLVASCATEALGQRTPNGLHRKLGTDPDSRVAPGPADPVPDPAASWDVQAAPRQAALDEVTADARTQPQGQPPETPPLTNPIPMYDPGGTGLKPFYAALARTLTQGTTTRIAFFGASHVASDMFTDVIRQRLQARFGDAGPGFTLTGKPWRWHRHGGVKFPRTRNFKGLRVLARAPKHDRYGLAGVALQSTRLRGISRIETRPHGALSGNIDHLEIYYLKQPRGGRVRVLIDGGAGGTIKTRGPSVEPGYRTFDLPLGAHSVEFRTRGDGPVRLFGAVLERTGGGVVLDTLGIPGSRARNHLYWDESLYRAHIEHRNPDLFVLAYGTNESGDDDVPIEAYESHVRNVIGRLQSILPHAGCLLVGPSDRPIREEDGTTLPRPRTGSVVAAQRRLAKEMGCAFYDVVAFMGGPMSMVRWNQAKPRLGAPDHVHLTRAGYQALGEALHDAMMTDFVAPPDAPAHAAEAMPLTEADARPGDAPSR